MAEVPFEARGDAYVGIINPQSTGHATARERVAAVGRHLLSPFHREHHTIEYIPSPLDISNLDPELQQIIVNVDSGDGGVRNGVAAIIGVIPNDPETSAKNMMLHQEIATRIRFFAGAGGNANNWALSAHGKFAKNPNALDLAASVSIGHHRPMLYEVLDDTGKIIQSNIATSCIGLNGPAIASARLQAAKPELKQKPRILRLASEAKIAFDAVRKAPRFTAEVVFQSPEHTGSLRLKDATGLEFIGSRIYAKEGRTQVNVDDTYWQPVVTRRYKNKLYDTAVFAETIARLKLGRHIIRPLDLDEMSVSIRVAPGSKAIQFHADGETNDDYRILPGQTLRLHLARIAIPVIMVA